MLKAKHLLLYKELNNINDLLTNRLDFEDFTINGPANSCEYDDCSAAFAADAASGGKCATDTLVVSSAQQSAPTICGKNTGQHSK